MPSPLDPTGVRAQRLNATTYRSVSNLFPLCNALPMLFTMGDMVSLSRGAHKSFRIRSYKNTSTTLFLTPLESALTNTPSRNPFRIRSYENTRGGAASTSAPRFPPWQCSGGPHDSV